MTATPRPRVSAGAIVFIGGLVAGLALAWLIDARPRGNDSAERPPDALAGAGDALARTGQPPRATRLDALGLRDTMGRRVDLATAGVPQVVMISSTSCVVCRSAFADFRALEAGGESFARLAVVTIEGADSGAVELRAVRVTPGAVLGPADEGARTTLTFQFPGTPVFIALDSGANVVASLPGYPGRAAMATWLDVMAGRRAAPE